MNPELAGYIRRRSDVLERIRRMLAVCLKLQVDPREIDPDTALFGTGLGIDSLDAVEIVVAMEIEFGISLADPILRRSSLRSVNSLVDLVLAEGEASSV